MALAFGDMAHTNMW